MLNTQLLQQASKCFRVCAAGQQTSLFENRACEPSVSMLLLLHNTPAHLLALTMLLKADTKSLSPTLAGAYSSASTLAAALPFFALAWDSRKSCRQQQQQQQQQPWHFNHSQVSHLQLSDWL
jgi:hypothetical protein